jgi:alkaline phosphatase
MRNSALALSFVAVLAVALAATAVSASIDLFATGTIVSKTSDTLVVRTADHGHKITFGIGPNTVLPDGLAVGDQVRIDYHATATGQAADKVMLIKKGAKR